MSPAITSKTSDRVGWYKKLGKHKRYVWIIKTADIGLVAMVAIGFWGVGSIHNAFQENGPVAKGQYMGHFAYGGSSIVLAFEPNMNLNGKFEVSGNIVTGPNTPLQMDVKQNLISP